MADPRIYLQSQPLVPVGNTVQTRSRSNTVKANTGSASFADILAKAEKKVNFSQHALQRM